MRYFRLLIVAFFLCSITVFSQDNNIKHTITKGETISSIAKKYNVSITAIYKLNPKSKKTLHLNQVLLIPNSDSQKTSKVATISDETTAINHEVLPKETLYGIAKQFKTTPESLYKANPQLETEGLKIGQTIIIPSNLSKKEIVDLSNTKAKETVIKTTPLTHQVKPKESLYVIAKKYGVSLKQLQNANPKIGRKGLSIGQEIIIPSDEKIVNNEITIEEKKPETKQVSVAVVGSKETVIAVGKEVNKETKGDSQTITSEIIHEVLPKETKYGIAKKYGITVLALEKQNPSIQQKLLVGSKLSIQVPNDTLVQSSKEEVAEAQLKSETKDTINATFNRLNIDLIDQLIQTASDKIGIRYRSGGTTTAGFDCSGFMCSTFGNFDIRLPRSSIEQSSFGEKIEADKVQKGDLIFFKTNGRKRINHVGMVVDVVEDEIKFIHSSTHSGVIISSTKEPYYQRNFVQVNRVIK